MMKRFLPLILVIGAVFVPMLFTHSCANTTKSPSGGPKDTIPPYIVYIDPLPGATGVPLEGMKIYFEFSEYIKINNAKNIYLSPPQSKPLKSRIRGKGIVVSFEEPLDSNTTYTISFTDAVADNNENNMFAGYTYVFSTGDKIDSMMVTGTVLDCNTLKPFKGATVLLYQDLADSAVFLKRPYAAAKTDDWGFFSIPFIKDTTYRIYAIKDDSGNNIYDPDADLVGFVDSVFRPKMVANDTIPEILKYDMKDTLNCLARRSEHELLLFREKPTKQFLKNHVRTGEYSAYITFRAPYAWIDSLFIRGYAADRIITEFNILQDSLGRLQPAMEHLRLVEEGARKEYSRPTAGKIKREDTTCVFKLSASGETVEQNGFELMFDLPVVTAKFDSLKFRYLNPRQKEFTDKVTVERDTANLRRYIIRPKVKLLPGYEYFLKAPSHIFRDIKGSWNDSTEVKVMLPKDESLSTLNVDLLRVKGKIIVDLLGEKKDKVLRSYVVDKDQTLVFPYLKEGKYSIRVTDDGNRNSIVDTGSLLEHRQPEKVVFVKVGDKDYIELMASSELTQSVNVAELLK